MDAYTPPRDLSSLPYELIHNILQHLYTRKDLSALSKVSKSLNITVIPILYQNIIFLPNRKSSDRVEDVYSLIEAFTKSGYLEHVRHIGAIKYEGNDEELDRQERSLYERKTNMLMTHVLRKIKANQLRSFVWKEDISLKTLSLTRLSQFQTDIELLYLDQTPPDKLEEYFDRISSMGFRNLKCFYITNISKNEMLSKVLSLLHLNADSLISVGLSIDNDFKNMLRRSKWRISMRDMDDFWENWNQQFRDGTNLPLLPNLQSLIVPSGRYEQNSIFRWFFDASNLLEIRLTEKDARHHHVFEKSKPKKLHIRTDISELDLWSLENGFISGLESLEELAVLGTETQEEVKALVFEGNTIPNIFKLLSQNTKRILLGSKTSSFYWKVSFSQDRMNYSTDTIDFVLHEISLRCPNLEEFALPISITSIKTRSFPGQNFPKLKLLWLYDNAPEPHEVMDYDDMFYPYQTAPEKSILPIEDSDNDFIFYLSQHEQSILPKSLQIVAFTSQCPNGRYRMSDMRIYNVVWSSTEDDKPTLHKTTFNEAVYTNPDLHFLTKTCDFIVTGEISFM